MGSIKTAVSIKDGIYERAEALAKELGVSRSRLYSIALEAFVKEYDRKKIMANLNAVYGNGPDPDDMEFLKHAREYLGETLEGEKW